MLYRNSTWSALFLLEQYGLDRAAIPQALCYQEQAAFQWLAHDYRISNRVKQIPNKGLNSYAAGTKCGQAFSPGVSPFKSLGGGGGYGSRM